MVSSSLGRGEGKFIMLDRSYTHFRHLMSCNWYLGNNGNSIWRLNFIKWWHHFRSCQIVNPDPDVDDPTKAINILSDTIYGPYSNILSDTINGPYSEILVGGVDSQFRYSNLDYTQIGSIFFPILHCNFSYLGYNFYL